MPCKHCVEIESVFDRVEAGRKLKEYHRQGPNKSTRLLLAALREAGVTGRTLLDIGGGIGAIQHELLKTGARSAVSVDASTAYLETARQEAQAQGLAGRVTYHHGDFVELAPEIAPADIVTLDRVICCYPNMPALVRLSAERAAQVYALVFPRDVGWVRFGVGVLNFIERLRGSAFRVFVHPTAAVEAILADSGLRRAYHRRTGLWQVALYTR
jgi:magnesium-protoporphyrin O-methyltransferase